jgi:chemotaxis signal transduction protein
MTSRTYQNTTSNRNKIAAKIPIVLIEIVLGTSRYLIDSDFVKEFTYIREFNPVYAAPAYVEGVTLFGDEKIPVINVAALLGTEPIAKDEEDEWNEVAIILSKGRISETNIAVLVDKVKKLIKIEKEQIMEANISGVEGIENFIKGIIRTHNESGEEEVLLYLNLEKLLIELLKGRISSPSPGLYIWRWIQSKKEENTPYGVKNTKVTRKSLW